MIDLKFQFNVDTFEALVRYFYTNCCEISLENVESFKALAKHCRSPKLIDLIQIKQKEIDEWSSFKVSLNLRNRTVRSWLSDASKESRNPVCRLVLESDEDDPTIRADFRSLADQTVPVELRSSVKNLFFLTKVFFRIRSIDFRSKISREKPNAAQSAELDIFSDVTLIIDQSYSFRLNQAFICTRTEYFSALVKNHFNEMISDSTEQRNPTMALKHIRKELFLPLIYYIYSDECDVSRTLHFRQNLAGFYETDRRRLCWWLTCLGRWTSSTRFETFVRKYLFEDAHCWIGCRHAAFSASLRISETRTSVHSIHHRSFERGLFFDINRFLLFRWKPNFSFDRQILKQEDFQRIVLEDASSVIDRQETDSITVIDDLRFYLTEFLSTNDDQSEKTSEKLRALDEFVERLGLWD